MRILVLTHRLPYAPNRGDRLRLYHVLKHLKPRAHIELVSLVHDREEAAHATEMTDLADRVTVLRVPWLRTRVNGVLALAGETPLTHALLNAPGASEVLGDIVAKRPPDVVYAFCSGVAQWAMKPPLYKLPLVIDFVDMDSQKWRELAAGGRIPLSWIYGREAARLQDFERQVAIKAAACLVVNEREAAIARRITSTANVYSVPNGVEIDGLRPPELPPETNRVVFCGVMNYGPNHSGMMWFVRDVWPLILAARPDATLAIVGADPQRALMRLCAAFPSITITGRVADVRPWLWESAVSVAPLLIARGVQNKALEAVAAGLPIVVTKAVAAGLPALGDASLVADDAPTFATAVIEILDISAEARRARALSADLRPLQWQHALEPLWPLLESAMQITPPTSL
jgi:sugar transferase (PEP-CTERM/EpsH1 system associated)